MNLIANCKSCKAEIKINSNAPTRPELEMDKGEVIKVKCEACGLDQEKHVNDVRAIRDNKVIIGGLLISLLVSIALFYFIGLFGVLVFVIPLLLWQQQYALVKTFNLYRTRR